MLQLINKKHFKRLFLKKLVDLTMNNLLWKAVYLKFMDFIALFHSPIYYIHKKIKVTKGIVH